MSCEIVVVHTGADIAGVSSAPRSCAAHVMFRFCSACGGRGPSACRFAVMGLLHVSTAAVSVRGRGCMDMYGSVGRARSVYVRVCELKAVGCCGCRVCSH